MSSSDHPIKRVAKPRRRVLIKVLSGLALLLLVFILKTAYTAGEFKSIRPHFSGTSRTIAGVVGGEDITIDHDAGTAYISADDRFARRTGQQAAIGAIYTLNLGDRNSLPAMMQRIPDEPIAPHGISLVTGGDSRKYLYIVDHFQRNNTHRPEHRILLYLIGSENQLSLVHTYEDKTFLTSPNDVVGIDEKRFYFTNDHGSVSDFGRKVEEYLQLSKSNIVYWDGAAFRFVVGDVAMANGINVSQDGRELYVASTLGKCLIVYHRDPETGDLSNRRDINLNTGVDNIELDESGNLWIGCHPKLLTFVRHAGDTSRLSPSQIIRLARTESGEYLVDEIFLDDGSQISGSAVGAVSGDSLLIGPVMDSKILWCELSGDKQDIVPSAQSE